MSTKIDQKAYLQKYLSGPSDKKKKKKKVIKGQGFKIIDDDIDISKIRTLDEDHLDIAIEGEDAPQVAGIIDERPEEIIKLEQFNTSKWRAINEDDLPSISTVTNKEAVKTLDGKMAGLSDAKQLKRENEEFRRKEEEAYRKMTDDVSGRNAKTVSRRGKRETSEERKKLKEKEKRQKEFDEKYKRWNKGVKQIEAQEAKVQEYLHEASKPLARHRDDVDLENSLKNIERAGDPMLQYMRERKREKGELGPAKPIYKGNFPPNRFNIRPGYRWDGVDRSNGYEKKLFEHRSKRKAQEEEAYKWSTEDL